MTISILGCGWLGFPLAKKLIALGHGVKGSTTSVGKITKFSSEGIQPYVISVSSEGISGYFSGFLEQTEVLIIDFPPGLRQNPKSDYVRAIENLILLIQKTGIQKVLFVSSIAVFQESEDFSQYCEESIPNGTSNTARQLISAENLFLKSNAGILRFGGLVGGGRHPVKQLSGRKEVKNPHAPVNLIQLEDCVALISEIIKKDAFGTIFHGVFPFHPQKEEYYTKKAADLGLPAPQFSQNTSSVGKIITASKLQKEIGFSFKKEI